MAARPKRVLVAGTHYHVKCSYGQQEDNERQAIERRKDLTEEKEGAADALRALAARVIVECVVACEDEEGNLVEITEENFRDEMDGNDFQRLFVYCCGGSLPEVQVVGALPLVKSTKSPPPGQKK